MSSELITLAPDSESDVTSTLTIQNGATVTATSITIAAGSQFGHCRSGRSRGNAQRIDPREQWRDRLQSHGYVTTLSANFTDTEGGTGTITKTGSGTVVLTGTVAGSVLTITGGDPGGLKPCQPRCASDGDRNLEHLQDKRRSVDGRAWRLQWRQAELLTTRVRSTLAA